jgi:hypothetical protein
VTPCGLYRIVAPLSPTSRSVCELTAGAVPAPTLLATAFSSEIFLVDQVGVHSDLQSSMSKAVFMLLDLSHLAKS